ncbi:hypothetical protein O5833_30030, partial [Escherichia coli]|nr:hypothetical protein [Escherichia coli]
VCCHFYMIEVEHAGEDLKRKTRRQMRQTALIALMAYIGSYVPAQKVGTHDRRCKIFSRLALPLFALFVLLSVAVNF